MSRLLRIIVNEGQDSETSERKIDSELEDENNSENIDLKENDNQIIDKELKKIRERRLNADKTFLVNTIRPRTSDDYTLVFGVLVGIMFFGGVFIASSGIVASDSIAVDNALSGTIFDSEDCTDKRDVMYFEIYSIDENIRIKTYNVNPEKTTIMSVKMQINENNTDRYFGGLGNQEVTLYSENIGDGNYKVNMTL